MSPSSTGAVSSAKALTLPIKTRENASKNDTKLLEIMITGVYLLQQSGDQEGLEAAVASAQACLKLFSEFEFSWSRAYYQKCIDEAAEGII